MAKIFKLKFFLSNFQLCRSSAKHPPTSFFSPVDQKTHFSLDVSLPTGLEPPPTTPIPQTPCYDGDENKAKMKMFKTLKSLASFDSDCDFNSYEFDESYSFDERTMAMIKGSHADEEKNKAAMKMLNTLKSFSSFNSEFTVDYDSEKQVMDESAAVVEVSSEEPYDDFKRSMVDMILQRKMYEVDDLERLLQCFLSLNSVEYHATIVEAFTEIWEILFSEV